MVENYVLKYRGICFKINLSDLGCFETFNLGFQRNDFGKDDFFKKEFAKNA